MATFLQSVLPLISIVIKWQVFTRKLPFTGNFLLANLPFTGNFLLANLPVKSCHLLANLPITGKFASKKVASEKLPVKSCQ